ncbi:MAG TPA: hypothetical protein VH481_10985 [Nitrososphaeraceae archaeon]
MCYQKSIVSTLSTYDKVIVELGMGDGQLLNEIIEYRNRPNTCYVGIEIDAKQIQKAHDRLMGKNIYLINDSFENVLSFFPDNFVDEFIFVLPSPNYIDRNSESQWTLLYQSIHKKLKERGTLTIVTEIINDLLEPISDYEFSSWKNWLTSKFVNLGFRLKVISDDCPSYYNSHFLAQFRGDKLRIKLITLILTKWDP